MASLLDDWARATGSGDGGVDRGESLSPVPGIGLPPLALPSDDDDADAGFSGGHAPQPDIFALDPVEREVTRCVCGDGGDETKIKSEKTIQP